MTSLPSTRGRLPVPVPAEVGHPVGSSADPRISSASGWPLVLYFHHVHDSLRHYTSLTPEAFARGLDTVLDRFEPIALDSLVAADGSLSRPDRPTVLITFDDGYADVLPGAVPTLAEREVPATFFVCTSLLDRRSTDPREDHLTWADCRDLRSAGHAIGSHGRSHRPLRDLPATDVEDEVSGSLEELGRRLGVTLPAYAYPYGILADIPGDAAGFQGPLTAFGTVKSPARPWTEARRSIRRTYLPTGEDHTWRELVAHWRAAWEG